MRKLAFRASLCVVVAALLLVLAAICHAPPAVPFEFLARATRERVEVSDPVLKALKYEAPPTYCLKADWPSFLAEAKRELKAKGYKVVFAGDDNATFYGPKSHVTGDERVCLWKGIRFHKGKVLVGKEREEWITIEARVPEPQNIFTSALRWIGLR